MSFRAVIAFMATAVCGLALSLTIADAATKKNKPSSKQPPTENQKLCRNGELMAELTNPVCLRWQITSVGSNTQESQMYNQSYPSACYPGSDMNMRCFFMNRVAKYSSATTAAEANALKKIAAATGGNLIHPRKACEAYADVQTQWSAAQTPPTTPANQRPFCGNGQLPSPGGVLDQQQFMCGLCLQGENGCTAANGKGKFVPGNACINFSGAPIQLRDVLQEQNASYCNTEINGPYSDFAPDHSYQVCGKTYTETYRGMVFTEDQKKKIRDINKKSTTNGTNAAKSDFAGFCWPKLANMDCVETSAGSGICKEQATLVNFPFSAWNASQIHHILPRTDKRECACGTNSVKNAAIISNHLNQYFMTNDRNQIFTNCNDGSPTDGMTEVEFANSRPKRVLPPAP